MPDSTDADLNTPCRHGNSPVTCVTCLNGACHETALLADLEEDTLGELP